MEDFEIIKDVMPKTLAAIDEDVKRKVDEHKIFFIWREIVGNDADEIFPVKISGKTLTLYSSNSSLKDKFKYRIPQLIGKINSALGDEVIDKIIFGRIFQSKPIETQKIIRDEIPAAEINLTDDEILECEKKSAAIENSERRKMLFDCLVTKKKSDKAKKISGWRKCILCENLCPPTENLCAVCKVREHNKMLQAIRKIFHDAPQAKFFDVKKKILELMPHMRGVCTLSVIESARMELIQQTASQLSFGDTESRLAKFFVMLVRQLPEESLTEKIISKTLNEFKFDLADRPIIKSQNFKKFSSGLTQQSP